MSAVDAARSLVEQHPAHRVVSLYLDLDPERFATPRARTSQIHSLLDGATREVEDDDTLDHEELVALRERIGNLLPGASVFVSALTEGGLDPLRGALLIAARRGTEIAEVRFSSSDRT